MAKKFFKLNSSVGELKAEVEITFKNNWWTVTCEEQGMSITARSKFLALEEIKDLLVRQMVGG